MHIVANWKMHGLFKAAQRLTEEVVGFVSEQKIEAQCIICPPATLIHAAASWVSVQENVHIGGQDCHSEHLGAYTGDCSAEMLKDAGAAYVIVGHSERRRDHGETDAMVAAKASAASAAGLTPIICIGESREDYDANRTIAVIEAQVAACVPDGYEGQVIIAYEPIWAIGSGKLPGLGEIEVVHSAIAATLMEKKSIASERISVLYGGSVNAANARSILEIPDVGGLLVGSASLETGEFCKILAATAEIKEIQ